MRHSALGPPPPRRRSSPAPLILAAVAIVLLSILFVWWRTPSRGDAYEDPGQVAGGLSVASLEPVLSAAGLSRPVSVAIVRDPASDDFYGSQERLDGVTQAWEGVLRAIGAEVAVVQPEDARSARVANVLVFPSSPCLSEDSYQAITAARTRGQGIIATWMTGTRDGECTAIGWGLLVRLTGATRLDTLGGGDEAYVTIPAGSALALGLPPGARLELLVGNHVAARRQGRAAFWSDFSLNPDPAQGMPLLDGAVIQHEGSGARSVYLGFELTSVIDAAWERELVRILVRNAVAWASRTPLVAPEPWPMGRTHAAVLAQDVEDRFANSRFALDTLRAAGVPGTFFLVTDLALDYPELARDLAAHGEIGTHSENHRRLGGLPRARQSQRLERTQRDLEALIGARVAGLRPPEEQFDAATIDAWRETGGRYLFAANNARAASPEIVLVGGSESVLLARVVNDDFDAIVRARLRDPREIADIFEHDYAKVRALGGLYMLSYHSNFLAEAEQVPALGMIARRLAADADLWLATAGDVAEWWRARHLLAITMSEEAGDLTITVRSGSDSGIDGVVLAVAVGHEVRSGVTGARLLGVANGVTRLALDPIPAGGTTTVRISGGARAQR